MLRYVVAQVMLPNRHRTRLGRILKEREQHEWYCFKGTSPMGTENPHRLDDEAH